MNSRASKISTPHRHVIIAALSVTHGLFSSFLKIWFLRLVLHNSKTRATNPSWLFWTSITTPQNSTMWSCFSFLQMSNTLISLNFEKIILHCRRQAGRASNDYSLIIEHILVQLIGHIGRFLHRLPTTFARNERSLFLRILISILVLVSIFNARWHAFSCTMGTKLKENVACPVWEHKGPTKDSPDCPFTLAAVYFFSKPAKTSFPRHLATSKVINWGESTIILARLHQYICFSKEEGNVWRLRRYF